jgi:hypothetical protein
MSYEDIVFFEEFRKFLGTLRGEINDLKEKLKDCANSIKKELFRRIKDKSRRIFNKSNKLTGKHRIMYAETRKSVFFEIISLSFVPNPRQIFALLTLPNIPIYHIVYLKPVEEKDQFFV